MKRGRSFHSIGWKGLALLPLVLPLVLWAAAGDQEKKTEKEKHGTSKPAGQQQTQSKGQTTKPQPQSQPPKAQPQSSQQPKNQPQYQQQLKAQPQYQQQPKAQPQYSQQPKNQPQYQQQGRPTATPQPVRTLAPAESQQQIQTLNRNRGTMPGINRNPLPQGRVSVNGDGSRTIAASGGRQFQVRPNGTVARVSLSGGRSATFRPNGGFASVRTGGMQIDHGLRGDRRIVWERPDHSRVVSVGLHRGYVERPYIARGGRTYIQRTYVINQVTYTRVYRTVYFGGMPYYHYVPPYYFHPVFYGWAYNPWRAPVYYRWSWYAAPPPWYVFWGPYFAPAPYYPSAAFWLTDFLLAESLKAAYDAGREDAANAAVVPDQPPPETYQPAPQAQSQITPEMRAAIAEEVQRQLAAEQQNAAPAAQAAPAPTEATPAALDPAQRLFVVSSNLAVGDLDGQECELTAGDIINRLDDAPDNNGQVRVSVANSKGNDCREGATLMVNVSDLQDMHNQLHEQTDSGLKALADGSGKGGLPAAPDTGTNPGEVPLPPPDPSVNSALAQQQSTANQAETQVQQEASQAGQN